MKKENLAAAFKHRCKKRGFSIEYSINCHCIEIDLNGSTGRIYYQKKLDRYFMKADDYDLLGLWKNFYSD